MVKDEYEIGEMRKAVQATKHGFDHILAKLPEALDKPRSERILEGAFNAVAREEGNALGYDTIIASGEHAPILHWMRNTGVVRKGDMLLIDAGVEVNSLYTADITRTFPTNGKFTDSSAGSTRRCWTPSRPASKAAKPGATYSDIHHACMRVIAQRLHDWGCCRWTSRNRCRPKASSTAVGSPAAWRTTSGLTCTIAHRPATSRTKARRSSLA